MTCSVNVALNSIKREEFNIKLNAKAKRSITNMRVQQRMILDRNCRPVKHYDFLGLFFFLCR